MKREPPYSTLTQSDQFSPGLDPAVPLALGPQEQTPALLIHLSPLLAFLIPGLGNILGPVAAWLVFRDRSPLLDAQAKEALNFQISLWIYATLGTALLIGLAALGLLGGLFGAAVGSDALTGLGLFGGVGLVLMLIPLSIFLYIIPIIFMVLAALQVSAGRPYHYPLTLRLVK